MGSGHAWQGLANLVADALWYGMWFLYGGLLACGACWCAGYGGFRAWQEWDRDWARRREERRQERRTAKEAARGLRAVEDFLQHQTIVDGGDSPQRDSRGHRWGRRQQ